MSTPFKQENRRLGIDTVLGGDELVLTSFTMHEELGRLYSMEVEMISANTSVDFNQMVGSEATVWVEASDGSKRYFHGHINRFAQPGHEGRLARYKATLVPWLWFLTKAADCRIFQKKRVPDIIEAVFQDKSFSDYQLDLNGNYLEREYCVQYRESDFNFVSRLMEEEGIYYYFKHEDGKHTLVLVDSHSSHENFPGYDEIEYRPETHAGAGEEENVTDWVAEMEVQTGAYVLADFNFTTPNAPIVANDNITNNHPQSNYEVFDYPGKFDDRDGGDAYAKLRIQAEQARHDLRHGQATSRGISAGYKLTLTQHPRDDQNADYLVTSTTFKARSGGYESGGQGGQEKLFECSFSAIPADQDFRPAHLTRRPKIRGPQTAIVVGGSDTLDEYGRIKVQFHWDRAGESNADSSCYVRVAQAWAGKGWGALCIPRADQEVVVEFMEGDPDRPLITGCVYNASMTVPFALPDNGLITTLKSDSKDGYNELRFQDKSDSEEIHLHGQKDLTIWVKNDRKEAILNDRHLVVKGNQFENVEKDKHSVVKGASKLEVTGTVGETLGADRKTSVEGNDNLNIQGKQVTEVTGDVSVKTDGNHLTEAGGKLSVKTTDDVNIKSGNNYNLESTAALHIKAGSTLVIEAGAQLSLKVGGSFVDIGPSGVSISGPMVNINSGGSAASGAGCSPGSTSSPDSPEAPTDATEADETSSENFTAS